MIFGIQTFECFIKGQLALGSEQYLLISSTCCQNFSNTSFLQRNNLSVLLTGQVPLLVFFNRLYGVRKINSLFLKAARWISPGRVSMKLCVLLTGKYMFFLFQAAQFTSSNWQSCTISQGQIQWRFKFFPECAMSVYLTTLSSHVQFHRAFYS